MSGVTVSNRVAVRSNIGRFIADIENAARPTLEETLDVGIRASRAKAPYKTGQLSKSFRKHIFSRTQGMYFNAAAYAKFQDEGVAPNPKDADVSFFWEHEAKWWIPSSKLGRNEQVINHPGNPAIHFMLAGNEAMAARAQAIMRKHYG